MTCSGLLRISAVLGFIVCVAFLGCSDDETIINQPNNCVPCDTCNNAVPGSGKLDDVAWMSDGLVSPDGRYIAFNAGNADYAYTERNFPIQGLSIMEIETQRIEHFTPGFILSYTWSMDSRKLYYVFADRSPIHEIDIEAGTDIEFKNIGEFSYVKMSPSNKYMFCRGKTNNPAQYGIFRWELTQETAQFVGQWGELFEFLVIDDTTLCGFLTGQDNFYGVAGIYYLNINTQVLNHIENETLRNRFNVSRAVSSISDDRTRILFDGSGLPFEDDGFNPNGVWMLNLETLDVRRILDPHPYWVYHERRPTWSSNTTFTADWYCRKDSTTLLYEYNLDGKPVRQLTRRDTEFWIVK